MSVGISGNFINSLKFVIRLKTKNKHNLKIKMEDFDEEIFKEFKQNYLLYIKNINDLAPMQVINTFCCISILISNKIIKEYTTEQVLFLWSNMVFKDLQKQCYLRAKDISTNERSVDVLCGVSALTNWFELREKYLQDQDTCLFINEFLISMKPFDFFMDIVESYNGSIKEYLDLEDLIRDEKFSKK